MSIGLSYQLRKRGLGIPLLPSTMYDIQYIQKGGLFGYIEWQPGLGSALTYSAPQWLLKHSARDVLVTYLPCVKYLFIVV